MVFTFPEPWGLSSSSRNTVCHSHIIHVDMKLIPQTTWINYSLQHIFRLSVILSDIKESVYGNMNCLYPQNTYTVNCNSHLYVPLDLLWRESECAWMNCQVWWAARLVNTKLEKKKGCLQQTICRFRFFDFK